MGHIGEEMKMAIKVRVKRYAEMQRRIESVLSTEQVSERERARLHVMSARMAEVYECSIEVQRIVESIVRRGRKESTEPQGELMGKLVALKIELYDELIPWMKKLERSLSKYIDKMK
jgi:hypothetical protein